MKVLILTGKFGMGHVSVAEALREELSEQPGTRAHVVDIIEYMFPKAASVIYSGFGKLSGRFSSIYNAVNRMDDGRNGVLVKGSFYKRFETLLDEEQPDVVISTLPVISRYAGAYIRYSGRKIGYIVCVTDIDPHSEWVSERADAYLAGDEVTRQLLIEKGVSSGKIKIVGIPVRQAFNQVERSFPTAIDRVSEKRKKEVLIMGGGLGIIPDVDGIMKEVLRFSDVHVTVIAGKNRKLQEALQESYPEVSVVGYTEHVADYMGQADLLISKAGGITVFEAIHSETPILALHPFLEQEIRNADLIERKKIGMVMKSEEEGLATQLEELLHDEDEQKQLRKNLKQLKASYTSNNVVNLVGRLAQA